MSNYYALVMAVLNPENGSLLSDLHFGIVYISKYPNVKKAFIANSVTVNGKKFKVTKGKKLTFTGNGKKYTATLKNDGMILDGNHAKDAFVKNMIKAGVVGKATVK